jgi:hypothetical protein
LGSYTYGDSAHLHAVTSIGSGSLTYTSTYDALGDMTCRAPDNTTAALVADLRRILRDVCYLVAVGYLKRVRWYRSLWAF